MRAAGGSLRRPSEWLQLTARMAGGVAQFAAARWLSAGRP